MKINGAELVVEAFGPTDAPAMIVHHGAPGLGSRSEPKRSFGPFADRFRVIVFDARGSGSPATTSRSPTSSGWPTSTPSGSTSATRRS